MPRKKNTQAEGYNEAFPATLRKLMEERQTTQQELADAIGKTRQAVSYYTDGSSSPDWKTVVGIAKFFNVSSDYLLGISDVASTDINIRAMCDYTGLSEDAVTALNELVEYGYDEVLEGISYLVEQEHPSPSDIFPEHFYSQSETPDNLKKAMNRWLKKGAVPVVSTIWDYVRTAKVKGTVLIDALGSISMGEETKTGWFELPGEMSFSGFRIIPGEQIVERVSLAEIESSLVKLREKHLREMDRANRQGGDANIAGANDNNSVYPT